MSLSRGALQEEITGYVRQFPLEGAVLAPLLDRISKHFHEPGDLEACAECPVVLTAATVLSETERVLHFWHPHRHQWLIRQDFVDPDSESVIRSAHRALVNAVGFDGLWVQPGAQLPVWIEVSFFAADELRQQPRRMCYTLHYLFRSLEEHLPITTGPWDSAKWVPLTRLRSSTLRRRVSDTVQRVG